jgi:Lar family restriction alleviation protein
MENLKPCPFCGTNTELYDHAGEYCVECLNCLSGTVWFSTKQLAIEAWNKRHRPTCSDCKHYHINKMPPWDKRCKAFQYNNEVDQDHYCAKWEAKDISQGGRYE